jgi:hypothetical protein
MNAFLLFSALLLFPYPAIASSPDVYEDDDSLSHARFIVPNSAAGPRHHNFHKAYDEDRVKFHGTTGYYYDISVINPCIYCDVVLELYDRSGNKIHHQDDLGEGEEEFFEWSCPQDGFYFIRVYQADPYIWGDNATYDLSLIIPSGCAGSEILGIVTDASDGKPIAGAAIKVEKTRSTPVSKTEHPQRCRQKPHQDGDIVFSDESGYYSISLEAGDYELSVQADGYKPSSFQATVGDMSNTDGSIALEHNCNGLSDAILILKIMSDMSVEPPICLKNQKIDMTHAIYILQTISGLR